MIQNLTLILVWGLCTVWQYFKSFGRTVWKWVGAS